MLSYLQSGAGTIRPMPIPLVLQQTTTVSDGPTNWSSDIKSQLLSKLETTFLTKFSHQSQAHFKTDQLQLVKFFIEDMEGGDPFFIPGQELDWTTAQRETEQSSYLNNFIDTNNIEDFEDIEIMGVLPTGRVQKEVLFNRFHTLSAQKRIDILYFICQNRIDSEQQEFMQELQAQSQTKPIADNNIDHANLRLSDELKSLLEPFQLGLLKPLHILHKADIPPDFDLEEGRYYYFPFFGDTRVYLESHDRTIFKLYLEDSPQIRDLLDSLADQPADSSLALFHAKLSKWAEALKKFAEDMRWKEASKVRKLKSQIRSRKLVETQKSKLATEYGSRNKTTDYLHERHIGRVVTRKQIDVEVAGMMPNVLWTLGKKCLSVLLSEDQEHKYVIKASKKKKGYSQVRKSLQNCEQTFKTQHQLAIFHNICID